MVKYFPNVEDCLVGHRLHRKSFNRYELKDVYLSNIVGDTVERNFMSRTFEISGIPDGLVEIFNDNLHVSNELLRETLLDIEYLKCNNRQIPNSLRKKKLKYELEEQVYRNSLSALKD